MTSLQPFGPHVGLAPGTHLIQASAGTGKTWSITTIVARQVVLRGRSLDQILVVSFTRAATAELRERVRGGLLSLATAIEETIHGGPVSPEPRAEALMDEMQALEGGLPVALRRLRVALSSFDQSSIFTI